VAKKKLNKKYPKNYPYPGKPDGSPLEGLLQPHPLAGRYSNKYPYNDQSILQKTAGNLRAASPEETLKNIVTGLITGRVGIHLLIQSIKMAFSSHQAINQYREMYKLLDSIFTQYLLYSGSRGLSSLEKAITGYRKLAEDRNPGISLAHITDVALLKKLGTDSYACPAKIYLAGLRYMREKAQQSVGVWPSCKVWARYRLWFLSEGAVGINVPAILMPESEGVFAPVKLSEGFGGNCSKNFPAFLFWKDAGSKFLSLDGGSSECGIIPFYRGLLSDTLIIEEDKEKQRFDTSDAPIQVKEAIRCVGHNGGIKILRQEGINRVETTYSYPPSIPKEMRFDSRIDKSDTSEMAFSYGSTFAEMFAAKNAMYFDGKLLPRGVFIQSLGAHYFMEFWARFFPYNVTQTAMYSVFLNSKTLLEGCPKDRFMIRITKPIGQKLIPVMIGIIEKMALQVGLNEKDIQNIALFKQYSTLAKKDNGKSVAMLSPKWTQICKELHLARPSEAGQLRHGKEHFPCIALISENTLKEENDVIKINPRFGMQGPNVNEKIVEPLRLY
jgi:hypothetical protein